MKRYIAALIIGCIAGNAYAVSTEEFVAKATMAGEFEVESSKLALEKSQDKDIKRFAQQMIDDHTKAGNQLVSILQAQNMAPPKGELDASHQKQMNKLEGLAADDFNRSYISMQTAAHEDAVKLFSDYSKQGDNGAIRDFAAQTLPVLQGHLQHVKKLKP